VNIYERNAGLIMLNSLFITMLNTSHVLLLVIENQAEPLSAVKRLTRLLHKSRKIRKRVRKYVVKNVPMSSKMHCFVNKCNLIKKK